MSMMQAVKSVFSNYANFHGRARRREYWLFTLFNILLYTAVYIIAIMMGASSYSSRGTVGGAGLLLSLLPLYGIAAFIPGLAVACRRLHDIGRSGAYLLFAFIPVVGGIILLIWLIQGGTPGANEYGPDPKEPGPDPQDAFRVNNAGAQGYGSADSRGAVKNAGGYGAAQTGENTRIPVLRGENGTFRGRSVTVRGCVTMGRSPENTVMFPQDAVKVSRRHCQFTVNNGKLYVEDLGSTNGTTVNGRYQLMSGQRMELNPGDRISIGSDSETFTVA